MEEVQLMLKRGGKIAGMFVMPLVFIDGTPYAEIPASAGGQVLQLRLNPALLHRLGTGSPSHAYEVPVEDPRSLS